MIQCSIITIGDELLIGQVIDTNSAWIARELNKAGINVKRRIAVGDIWQDIWDVLDETSSQSDVILLTGGLGPTADDITKPLLCSYFGGKMLVNKEALENVNRLFENVLKRPPTERNLKQAEVPDVCKVLPNHKGTAPGMWFEKEGKIFISMPGVPFEMKGMMQSDVIPALIKRFIMSHIAHRTLLTSGIGESALADMLIHFEETLPADIKLAYLPHYGMVRLRLSSTGLNKESVEKNIDLHFSDLRSIVADYLVSEADESMEEVVGRLLKSINKTVCTAESCTGGYIAHCITSVAGASAYYEGSVVSYSYKAKEDLLNVHKKTLLEKGAVSEEVVREMATGVLNKTGSDYAIAVSGILGPEGGMPGKPVGTVWIAIGNKDEIITEKLHFRYDRALNIQLTAANALNMLRKFILQQYPEEKLMFKGNK